MVTLLAMVSGIAYLVGYISIYFHTNRDRCVEEYNRNKKKYLWLNRDDNFNSVYHFIINYVILYVFFVSIFREVYFLN